MAVFDRLDEAALLAFSASIAGANSLVSCAVCCSCSRVFMCCMQSPVFVSDSTDEVASFMQQLVSAIVTADVRYIYAVSCAVRSLVRVDGELHKVSFMPSRAPRVIQPLGYSLCFGSCVCVAAANLVVCRCCRCRC